MRYLFRVLPIMAIIFQAGISGAWWAGQLTVPLPPAWGWFGAGIIGITIQMADADRIAPGERRSWLVNNPGAYSVAELARQWGVSERTVRRDLVAAGFHKNGDGRWHR